MIYLEDNNNMFRVQQLDHVELFVPDQFEAAKWYEQVLGLEVMPAFLGWADGGPLMISSDNGSTKLALFRGNTPGFHLPASFKRVAFRVDGSGFMTFLERLKAYPVHSDAGILVNYLFPVDHGKSYSVYFCDPYGNRYEVTSYDYGYIAQQLATSHP